jgi:hypothetical protein
MPMLQQPEVYLGHVTDLFSPDGGLSRPETSALLQAFIAAFATLIERVRR